MPKDFNEEEFNRALTISQERLDQKEIYLKANDFNKCNSEIHLDSIMEDLFTNWEETKKTIIFNETGVTKKIVDAQTLVYSTIPERTFTVNNKDVADDQKDYILGIYKDLTNEMFSTNENLCNALSHVSLKLFFDEESKKIKFQFLTPDKYDVITEERDLTKAKAFFYEVHSEDDMTTKQLYTVYVYIDKYVQYKVVTTESTAPNQVSQRTISEFDKFDADETAENPYGVIPIVTTQTREPVMEFFVDDNARLFATGEASYIIKDVGSNDSTFYQGFSQPVFTSQTAGARGISDSVKMGKRNLFNIKAQDGTDGAEKFEFVSPDDKIEALAGDKLAKLQEIASVFGIGEGDGTSAANMSGVSIALSDDAKNKQINKAIPRYIDFENNLFELIKIINNTHAGENKELQTIDEKTTISVDFKEITTSVSIEDQNDTDQFLLDNELKAKYRILMGRNQDLSEDEAKAIVKEAELEAFENNKKLNDMTNPNNEESLDDE